MAGQTIDISDSQRETTPLPPTWKVVPYTQKPQHFQGEEGWTLTSLLMNLKESVGIRDKRSPFNTQNLQTLTLDGMGVCEELFGSSQMNTEMFINATIPKKEDTENPKMSSLMINGRNFEAVISSGPIKANRSPGLSITIISQGEISKMSVSKKEDGSLGLFSFDGEGIDEQDPRYKKAMKLITYYEHISSLSPLGFRFNSIILQGVTQDQKNVKTSFYPDNDKNLSLDMQIQKQ